MAELESNVKSTAPPREDAGEGEVYPYLALLWAWLIPGAGHVYLGRWTRGLSYCLIVLASLILGCVLDGKLYRVLPNQPLSVLGTLTCMGTGLPYFILRYALGYEGDVVAPGYEYGTAFLLTAGLMNLLLILDVWDIARGKKD